MRYTIRKAQKADMDSVKALYAGARRFMEEHDNPDQWGKSYPSESMIYQDIADGNLYLLWNETGIHGVFFFSISPDSTYAVIDAGQWNYDRCYGVIHRIAGDGSGGILRDAVEYAHSQIPYVRIDTHEDNYVMQNALEKQGFRRCGTVYMEDGSSRIAYDSFCGVREAVYGDFSALMSLYMHLHETQSPERDNRTEAAWKQILEDPRHHLIVYEKRGKIVSSCVCVVIPNLTRGVRPYALIENVVTHCSYRGQGFATACLAFAKQIAIEEHCYKMMLLTGARDKKIWSFYENAGFNCQDKTAFVQWLS